LTLAVNGLRGITVRRLTTWGGPWLADVTFDLDVLPDAPKGRALLTIGTTALLGTFDPRHSGRMGPIATARIIAGAGGWQKTVGARHYHNDGGVLSTAVLATTAAEVLESVVDAIPSRLGVDFDREEGQASSVLDGHDWHVDATGITIVGPRATLPALPTLEVLEWDPGQKLATIAISENELVEPGTILTDTRFGTAIVRDVEQTWNDSGARARAWCMPSVPGLGELGAGPRFVAAIGAIARAATGVAHLQAHRYRVIAQGIDGRFILQAISKGAPDLKLIDLAPAVPGMSVKVTPATVCHVTFADGDPTRPSVVRFEGDGSAIEIILDTVHMHVGSGLSPKVGPVALAIATEAAFAAIVAALNGYPITAPVGAALASALGPILPLLPSTALSSE
jgi:hypothetical protein